MVLAGIQISRSLLYQLTEEEDQKLKKKTKKTKPRIPRESKKPQQKQIPNDHETQKGTPSAGWPLQAPLFLPTPQLSTSPNPAVEEIRSVLKQSTSVLEEIQKVQDNMVKEVTERAKELHEKEFKLPQQKPVICEIERDACKACYKDNVNDALRCSTVVNSYRECVRRARKQAQVPSS